MWFSRTDVVVVALNKRSNLRRDIRLITGCSWFESDRPLILKPKCPLAFNRALITTCSGRGNPGATDPSSGMVPKRHHRLSLERETSSLVAIHTDTDPRLIQKY